VSEQQNAEERRFAAQDVLELLDELGVAAFLEGSAIVRLREARGKLSAALAWRVKQLEPELAALLRERAERIKKGALS
jgi:hypothetical protein